MITDMATQAAQVDNPAIDVSKDPNFAAPKFMYQLLLFQLKTIQNCYELLIEKNIDLK